MEVRDDIPARQHDPLHCHCFATEHHRQTTGIQLISSSISFYLQPFNMITIGHNCLAIHETSFEFIVICNNCVICDGDVPMFNFNIHEIRKKVETMVQI